MSALLSFWEIAIKRRAGKLLYDGSPPRRRPMRASSNWGSTAADAERAGALDWSHRDPFDRMLVAHCLNRDLTLVTADARLEAKDDIAAIYAR